MSDIDPNEILNAHINCSDPIACLICNLACRVLQLEAEIHEWEESDAACIVLGPILVKETERADTAERRVLELEAENKRLNLLATGCLECLESEWGGSND